MTQEETYKMIEILRASCIGFHVDPKKGTPVWHEILKPFTNKEAWNAAKHIMENTDSVPTHRGIKMVCIGNRRREANQTFSAEGARQMKAAADSFSNVPGETMAEKRLFIVAERCAEHWRTGETDNDFWNSKLLAAQKIGFEFFGIDYSKVTVSAGYDFSWFDELAECRLTERRKK